MNTTIATHRAGPFRLLDFCGSTLTVMAVVGLLPALYLFGMALMSLPSANDNALGLLLFGMQGLLWLPAVVLLLAAGQVCHALAAIARRETVAAVD